MGGAKKQPDVGRQGGKVLPFELDDIQPIADPPVTESERREGIEVPLVLPGDARSRSKRGLRPALQILGLLAVVAAGWWVFRQLDLEGEAVPASFATPERDPSVPDAFQRDVEAFEARAAGYEERSADFELGRLDCDGLRSGYRVVDEAFVELSERYGALSRNTDVDRRYEAARQAMGSVEAHFTASGCSRQSPS